MFNFKQHTVPSVIRTPIIKIPGSSVQFWVEHAQYVQFELFLKYKIIIIFINIIDLLQAGRSGDRILVGERFTISFFNGPRAHAVPGHFPEVNWLGRGVDHPPHLVPRLKKEKG